MQRLHLTPVALAMLAVVTACANEVEFASSNAEIGEGDAEVAGLIRTYEKEFPAAQIDAQSLTLSPEYRRAFQQLTLTALPPTTQSFQQIARTAGTDGFKQGRVGRAYGPENFAVADAGKLDLLVVVDNSTSMDTEQANLASKLDSLVSRIDNTDWQIAVVTTSSPCLRNARLIRKVDPDRVTAFQNAVIVPLDNTVVEKGFPMAIRALNGECNGVTTPWTRAGSSIGVLILSDEDNCGSHAGEGCVGEPGETAQQIVDFLAALRPAGRAKIYGLFEGANECGTSAFTATRYKQGVDATGGTWGSICQADYTTTLQAISDNVSRIVRREFTLAFPPDVSTLQVMIDGQPVSAGVSLAGNLLTIGSVEPDDVTLSVSYVSGSVPMTDSLVLAAPADPATLVALVNQQAVSADKLSYDPATRELAFTDMPPEDADVVVSYRHDGPLPTAFPLAAGSLLGKPLVTVGGAETQDFVYDAATGALTFGVPPADGAEVRAVYNVPADQITAYPAALAETADLATLMATDATTAEPLSVVLTGGELVFSTEDALPGREVVVTYDLGYAEDALVLDLGAEPLAGTLVMAADSPEACTADPVVEGTRVTLACGPKDAGTVQLDYQVVTERFDTFTLEGDIPEGATWQVFVDGVLVKDYERVRSTVRLPAASLTLQSKVRLAARVVPEAPRK